MPAIHRIRLDCRDVGIASGSVALEIHFDTQNDPVLTLDGDWVDLHDGGTRLSLLCPYNRLASFFEKALSPRTFLATVYHPSQGKACRSAGLIVRFIGYLVSSPVSPHTLPPTSDGFQSQPSSCKLSSKTTRGALTQGTGQEDGGWYPPSSACPSPAPDDTGGALSDEPDNT